MTQRAHAELICKWAEDESIEIECSSDGGESWNEIYNPSWYPSRLYRIKATKPSIDWSHVAPEYKWLSIDCEGEAWLWSQKPIALLHTDSWAVGEDCAVECAKPFASYKTGTCDWENSLVERPEGV